MKLQIKINRNGSFNVLKDDCILLRDCFPTINGRPLRTISTSVSEKGIEYVTEHGKIHMSIDTYDETSAGITMMFEDFTLPVRKLSVIGDPIVDGLQGAFELEHNTVAQGGYITVDEIKERGLFGANAYGIVALDFRDSYLTVFAERHDKFENMYCLSVNENGLSVTAEFLTENVNKPNEVMPIIRILLRDDLTQGLTEAATVIAENMNARRVQPPAFHWCSWYYYYQNFDQPQLEECLQHFPGLNLPLQYMQIDEGYCNPGDWLIPNERWPKGLEGAFADTIAAGYTPGIWIAPFMVGNRSQLYTNHPDWIVRYGDGRPVIKWIMDNEPKVWGLQDEEYYALDTSNPEAFEYLRNVFRTLRQWGAGLFKTDFMLWGLEDDPDVVRHTPGKTSVEYFRDVLEMIREEIGDSYWLGCIAPFMPFIGYCDGMRVGSDVGSSWSGDFNPWGMIKAVSSNIFTNHLFYQIDPDALILRDYHVRLKEREVYSLTLLAALSGGCVYTSDTLHKIAPDRLELFRFVQPDGVARKPYLPYLASNRKDIVLVHRNEENGKVILFIFNGTDDDLLASYSMEELKLDKLCFRDFYAPDEVITGDILYLTTPAHGCRLLIGAESSDFDVDIASLWGNLK